jgi:hypothetical protein
MVLGSMTLSGGKRDCIGISQAPGWYLPAIAAAYRARAQVTSPKRTHCQICHDGPNGDGSFPSRSDESDLDQEDRRLGRAWQRVAALLLEAAEQRVRRRRAPAGIFALLMDGKLDAAATVPAC